MKTGEKAILGGALLKASGIVMILFLCLFFIGKEAESQQLPSPSKREIRKTCRKDPSIVFTEEQAGKLADLHQEYSEEIRFLWSELREIRMELRFAITDSQVQSQALLDKQRKISKLQAKLQDLSFSYQIKFRSILTREQLERMPPDCPLKVGKGYGIGKGFEKGPRKGIR